MLTDLEPRVLTLGDHDAAVLDLRPEASGIPLVLLHGGAVDRRMWSPQLERHGDRRLVVPDARGHGLTSSAAGPHRLCDDVVGVLDALAIDRAVLVGVSMGGGTAVDTALEHPGRVAGLVVSGTGTSVPEFREPWALEIFARWQAAERAADAEGWIAAFMEFVPGPRRSRDDVDPNVWGLVETMARELLAAHVTVGPDGTPVQPVSPTPIEDPWGRLGEIGVPVLGLAGALDGDDHVAMVKRLVDTVQDGTYVEIVGAAHYPNLENPRAFDAALEAFLGAHDL